MEKSILSKTIDILRFPIMLGVVAEHAFFQTPSGDGYPVYSTVKFFLSDVSTEVLPPPLFFLVSGMLFFWGLEKLSSSIYFQKIRKRFRTVLIPYLFWNLLILGVLYVGQTFFADLAGQEATRVSDYSIKDWLWAFWDTSKGTRLFPFLVHQGRHGSFPPVADNIVPAEKDRRLDTDSVGSLVAGCGFP